MILVTRSDVSNARATEPDPRSESDGSALLPDPSPSWGGAADDAIGCLYAVLSQLRSIDFQSGEASISENKTLQDAALADQRAALKREEANEAGSGRGFFSSIGHLISDVAGDVAHGRFGQSLSDAGSDIVDAWNSPKFWSDVISGLKAVAVVADGIGAAAQEFGGEAGIIVGCVSGEVEDVATAGAALGSARGEHFAAVVLDAKADGTAAQNTVDSLQTAAGWTLDDLKSDDESQGRALDAVRSAIGINDKTLLVAASITVRG
jgi:hypothetical protein